MRLGVHISGVHKIYEAFKKAHGLGCNTMQIFSRNPQQWRQSYLEQDEIKEFNKRKKDFKIHPVFIHIPYLINLASPNPRLYEASIEAYIEDILEAHLLGADYIVTHMGSHKETSEEAGLERLTQALNTIIAKTKAAKVGILLENTSGSGSWLGYKFIHHKIILDGIKNKERIGLCIDTAHAYLAGYNIAIKEGLEQMISEIANLVGINLIKLVHLNDAKGKLGSHHDRHDHIGKGHIGLEGLRRFVNHKAFKNVPFILETPKDNIDADRHNLKITRKLFLH
jgi:deoxyribonuclease-4